MKNIRTMTMRTLGLLTLAAGLFYGGLLQAAQIESVRLWRAPDNTRLVFDLTGPAEHKLFTLSNPERIVIDIAGTRFEASTSGLDLENTPLTGVRSAPRDNELRVVLDLSREVKPKSFSLPPNQQYGHRLVIDLYDSEPRSALPTTAEPSAAPLPQTPTRSVTEAGQRDIIVALDAGHGGEDPGAIGHNKALEKDVVLAIAKETKKLIDAEPGFKAVLVRTGDYFIPLRKRTEIARKHNADLFVSIHADAFTRASAFGASVYALSDRGATSETARLLADRENRSDLIGGVGGVSLDNKDQILASVLLDLSMTATLSASLDVGQQVLSSIGKLTPLHKRRVEQAGFMVLKSPDIPSILVETGFISNPGESRKLVTRSHQQGLARAMHSGIRSYFHRNPPPGTRIAALKSNGQLAQGPREHTVTRGDTLSMIATRYEVSLASLRQANGLGNDQIRVGQVLKVPAGNMLVKNDP
ncbi:N-acetylmuramoyl-L-alanine amidase [Pseudomonas saudimassiliensis]|uniref:N-acetylmuramoyl-L-alanine amidase AmiC n=2 Tax=Pseudomonas saudimassiliensis TaxID=1461581 RepID=A0A078MKF7_9PSED|nr:N-acetylmuramoyl-L-alanine amidase [Pseudomonas saudimassiliensis]CEF27392.1 N-acetylmuramoyl-L-alanine amidase [Pseudomonas saudimassiliensis]